MLSRSLEPQELDRVMRDPARLAALEQVQVVAGEALDRIAGLIRAALGADIGIISFIDGDRQHLKGVAGLQEPFASVREFPVEGGICPLVLASQEAVFIEDVSKEDRLTNATALNHLSVAAYAGAPLRDASGIVLGTVCAISRTPRAWSTRDRALLDHFASFASLELEREIQAASVEMNRVRTELSETQLLQSISAAMIQEENVDELYKLFVDAAVTIMHSQYGTMQMLVPGPEEPGDLVILGSRGFDERELSYWRRVSADAGSTCGQALRTRSRVIAEDFRECAFALRRNDREAFIRAGIFSAQSTPLYSRKGSLLGMISTHWTRPHRPSEHDLQLLDILARQAADVLERRLAGKALRESEQRFRAFVETSSDVVYRMNADWSETLSEPHGNWIEHYIHPDDRPNVLEQIKSAVATKSPFDFEHRVTRADGTLGWTHSRAIPLLDENGEISEWFGTATDVTLKKQAQVRQRQDLQESQRMTATLQAAFLPQMLPRVPGLQFDAAYLPAGEGALIGGDWYDVAVLPDGRLLLCVGDVTGHGLDAAMTASKLRQAVTAAAFTTADPAEALSLVNRVLRFQQPDVYATAMLAFVDRDCSELTYASAGHPAAFLAERHQNAVIELHGKGLPLGVVDALDIETRRISLPKDFALAFYSDGLTEFARDIPRAEQAIKGVLVSLNENPARRPARAVLNGVLGDTVPNDDVVVLLMARSAF